LDEIVVGDSTLEKRKLTSRFTVPRRLRKYFRSLDFFAIYDEDIDAEKSILNIPSLATVLPFAWLAGVDVYVDELDKAFKESMDQLQQIFQKDHPNASFTTHIIADTLVENEIRGIDPLERTGLLFSGGVDSTYTLLTHLDLQPRLITFWGADNYPYPENAAQWQTIIATYTQFAQQMGLHYNVVKTNTSGILDDYRISHDFHQYLYDGWFRLVLQHTFVLIPLAAPLSMGRFNHLLISGGSPRRPDDNRPPGPTRPETDEKFIWADLKVKHVVDIYREKKISGAIKDSLQKYNLKLKVCLGKLEKPQLNDSTCVKCLRAIANLALAGIDGNKCGFHVNESTWTRFKEYLKHDLEKETFGTLRPFLRMQQNLPNHIDHDFYGSRDFFNWFRDFDIQSKEKDVWTYRDIYHSLPYPMAKILDKLYSIMGIRIHDNRPLPRKKTLSPA
jgi:hypothetical protein